MFWFKTQLIFCKEKYILINKTHKFPERCDWEDCGGRKHNPTTPRVPSDGIQCMKTRKCQLVAELLLINGEVVRYAARYPICPEPGQCWRRDQTRGTLESASGTTHARPLSGSFKDQLVSSLPKINRVNTVSHCLPFDDQLPSPCGSAEEAEEMSWGKQFKTRLGDMWYYPFLNIQM